MREKKKARVVSGSEPDVYRANLDGHFMISKLRGGCRVIGNTGVTVENV